ncbi:MAG: hypothetical protein LBQ84_09905 [Flavobacteriaceae bacterium]|jgi:hypothetical protein|nr:hypothetical protein [Flavobacteriaceae bacterium]
MKKFVVIFSLFLSGFCWLSGQEEVKNFYLSKSDKESHVYHEYRLKPTVPSYGLTKIQAMISKINIDADFKDEDDEEGHVDYFSEGYWALSDKEFNKLSPREKFTYVMIHPEVNTQNCDIQLNIEEEHKKIFANLPNGYDEVFWSNRQVNFLKKNRDLVVELIKESALESKRVGFNYKMALEEINAVEMVPFLIEFYSKSKKDKDILTLLMLLMKNNKYAPFLRSTIYRELYDEEGEWDSFYRRNISYNKSNEDQIIDKAKEFYIYKKR